MSQLQLQVARTGTLDAVEEKWRSADRVRATPQLGTEPSRAASHPALPHQHKAHRLSLTLSGSWAYLSHRQGAGGAVLPDDQASRSGWSQVHPSSLL